MDQPSGANARISPRQSVACPFPQEEVTVRPKITIRIGQLLSGGFVQANEL
ncbi:hypothetical protein MPLSOD_50137 [Mesorhizobium sp. SOD10]|nr:hypothetical protein MPLSOD_50137 [Mesorhizobium sp. SOD10]